MIKNRLFSQNKVYRISFYKFQKIKEYLNENFFKDFIILSKAFYFLSILFVLKINNDLRFYIDYRKLNAIIKRNRYFFFLIKKIIEKILNYKYFIRLNIIAAFNKFRMNSDNEDFTIFIIALRIYKYKILSFGLTNELNSFQQYINEILWNFFDNFVQIYLNNIFIYSKIKKKHRRYIVLIFQRLRETGFQINIKKCEFDVKKTIFLEIIISSTGLRMNLKKVEIIFK